MNETMSLLLATTILALGGLGLYMFKSSDETQTGGDEEYNEENIFGSNGLFNWGGQSENNDEVEDIKNDDEKDYKPRKRASTQKNRKTLGSSRRRYY
jgi:hypothetical protein